MQTERSQSGDGQNGSGQEGEDIIDRRQQDAQSGLLHEKADLVMIDDIDDLLIVVHEKEHIVDAETERKEGDDLGGSGVEMDAHPGGEAESRHAGERHEEDAGEAESRHAVDRRSAAPQLHQRHARVDQLQIGDTSLIVAISAINEQYRCSFIIKNCYNQSKSCIGFG